MSQTTRWFWILLEISVAVLLLLALINLIGWHLGAKILVIPALIATFALTAGFERIREFIRGPYVMASWLYANELTTTEVAKFKDQGMLPRMYWLNVSSTQPTAHQSAEALFGQNCTTCHTVDGLNAIRDRVRDRSPDGIAVIINHTRQMVPWMPPFAGNRRESELMAAYFYELAHTPSPEKPSYFPEQSPEKR